VRNSMAAMMQHLVPHVLRSNDDGDKEHHRSNDSAHGSYPPSADHESHEDMLAHEEEKRFISAWEDNKHPLTPAQVAEDPQKKKVGHSSRHLRLDDFELVKTLGTGAHITWLYWDTRQDWAC
jgi:protein kinase A